MFLQIKTFVSLFDQRAKLNEISVRLPQAYTYNKLSWSLLAFSKQRLTYTYIESKRSLTQYCNNVQCHSTTLLVDQVFLFQIILKQRLTLKRNTTKANIDVTDYLSRTAGRNVSSFLTVLLQCTGTQKHCLKTDTYIDVAKSSMKMVPRQSVCLKLRECANIKNHWLWVSKQCQW